MVINQILLHRHAVLAKSDLPRRAGRRFERVETPPLYRNAVARGFFTISGLARHKVRNRRGQK